MRTVNLQPVTHPRPDQRLVCYDCGRMYPAETMHADLDGPAFRAYYCSDCRAVIARTEG